MSQHPNPPLSIRLEDPQRIPEHDPHRLARIRFGETNRTDPARPDTLDLALPPLPPGGPVEVWRATSPVTRGFEAGIGFTHTDEVLFGWMHLDEDRFGADLAAAAEHTYARILSFHQEMGFPALLRVWNYFPRLHERQDGLDRYQIFCLGRHRALAQTPLGKGDLPAATAIGTRAPGLVVYFLAGREPGRQIENPRQVSAFCYPARYGPRSPSFSRATLRRWQGSWAHLYISGTASIVGHETRHQEPLPQLREILENLRAVMQATGEPPLAEPEADPARLSLLKVYVRHAADAADIRAELEATLDPVPPLLLLRGDICREDLLVEIEGLHA
ncbi:MAG: hypothetical protein ACLFMW_00335 [Ectothiorhodospira sp.]